MNIDKIIRLLAQLDKPDSLGDVVFFPYILVYPDGTGLICDKFGNILDKYDTPEDCVKKLEGMVEG